MKEKIVFVGPAYPYRGGQATVEAHMYDTLTNHGYDCHTVSFTLLYPKIFFPGKTQYDQSEQKILGHQERIYRIINSINPFSWFKAIRKIKALNPSNVVFIWWMPFFGPAYWTIARFLKKQTNTKITFLVENYISHEKRWFDQVSSKLTLGLADYFICQSEFEYGRISAVHKKQKIFKTTLMVLDCFDLNKYDKASAKEFLKIKTEKVVMFFGLIRRYKGLDKLIQAFNTIKETHGDVTLLIVGECYEDIEYYEDLIDKEGIREDTILVNQFINNEDVEPYYKAADMVCLPYNSASQSGILMMAYGFQIPVVVNNVGGLPELVVEGKTGTIIPDNTPPSIAEGVSRIYENKGNEDYKNNIRNLNKTLGYLDLQTMMAEIIES